ncbi:MAG: hypothetical protein RL074_276 [Bacteroidota bacterium]|mgnify:FL=1|jgi:uncharacterized protein YxjI|uniref:SPOR domain-containing protein n=1 Tax=Flavobacterium sp. TaxID=239 RepID=UPI00286F67D4|nr:SPOR domain-containing protein [Flavobacterium sp.]
MRILRLGKPIFYSMILSLSVFYSKAQIIKNTANNDSKIEQLLNEKRKINSSIALNDRYKIQIFSGESEKAKKTVVLFKQEFKEIDATIVFNTPNYKVWVGNFKTRMEAERNFVEIKKKYKNVLLIKPNK